jgi:hypothetical protein
MKSLGLSVALISMSFQLAANPCWAFGTSGGDDAGGSGGTGGCCANLPKELQEGASRLRKEFVSSKRQELLDQQILGTICEKHSCGNLAEGQADKLLDRFFLEQDRLSEETDKSESRWLSRFAALLGAGSLLLSWLAYRQSKEAERQSVRNEVEIEHLKEKPSERTAG